MRIWTTTVALLSAVLLMAVGLSSRPRPSIVINEINYNPLCELDSEYVELWNHGASPVELSGWSFIAGVEYTFPKKTILQPDCYLVVAEKPSSLSRKFPNCMVFGPWENKLSNQGERLCLVDERGRKVEEVFYSDKPPWSTTADGHGASLERCSPFIAGNRAENWCASREPNEGGDWEFVEAVGKVSSDTLQLSLQDCGEVLLDDVQLRVEDGGVNFLIEAGFETTLWLEHWTLIGKCSGSSRQYMTRAPEGEAVLALRASFNESEGLLEQEVPSLKSYYGKRISLSFWVKQKLGDCTVLGGFKGSPPFLKRPLKVQPEGTPGFSNRSYDRKSPPQIYKVLHCPSCPKKEQVTVHVFAKDDEAVEVVQLHWTQGDKWSKLPMERVAGSPKDGKWICIIPSQERGKLVRYFVTASDNCKRVNRSPAVNECVKTYCFLSKEPERATVLAKYELLTKGQYSALAVLERGQSNYKICDYISLSSRKGGYNVSFVGHRDHQMMSGCNLIWQGTLQQSIAEYLSWKIHENLGLPSPYVDFVMLSLNEEKPRLYLLVEQPNRNYFGRNGFDKGGNLYELDPTVFTVANKTRPLAGNRDFLTLEKQLAKLDEVELGSIAQEWVDLDSFVMNIVAHQLTSNRDGYWTNFLLYHDVRKTERWFYHPWDLDFTWDHFGWENDQSMPTVDMPITYGFNERDEPLAGHSALVGHLLSAPHIQREYFARLKWALETSFLETKMFALIDDLLLRLSSAVESRGASRDELESIGMYFKNYVKLRRAYLITALQDQKDGRN